MESEILGTSPEFHKGSNELTLIPLSADMRKTHHTVLLQECLNYDISIDSMQIKVNGEAIDHINSLYRNVIVKNPLELRLRDILYSSMLNEFVQGFEENCLGVIEVLLLIAKG